MELQQQQQQQQQQSDTATSTTSNSTTSSNNNSSTATTPRASVARWFQWRGREYEVAIGRRYRLSLQLLDDVEVTVRFGLAIAGVAALLQFMPTEQLAARFPVPLQLGIVIPIIFLAPFLGTAIGNSLSWVAGALVGCALAIATIEALGPTRADEPSGVALAALLFVVVFVFVYHGTSISFIKSSTITYCDLLIPWYSDIKDPTATVPGPYNFLLTIRTPWLSLAVALAALALPLPQFGWPWLLPLPRMALPKVLTGAHKAADMVAGVFGELARRHELGDSGMLQLDEFGQRLLVRIENTERMLHELQGMMELAGRWEPLLSWPAPRLGSYVSSLCGGGLYGSTLRVGNLEAVISNLLLLCFLQRNHIEVMRRRADPASTAAWSRAMAPDLLAHLEHLATNVSQLLRERSVLHTLSPQYDRSSAATAERQRLEAETLELVSSLSHHMREHVAETLDETNAADREIAFHCNALVRLSIMASTAVTIARLASEPPIGPSFAERAFSWLTDYLRYLKGGVANAFRLVTLRESPRKYLVHRHRRLAGSFLVSLAVLLSSLFVLIDKLRTNVPTGTGVVTNTLILMDRDLWASNLVDGEQRLAGTALAIAACYWLSALWPNGNTLGSYLFIVAYCVVARYIQCNPRWNQLCFSFETALFMILYQNVPVRSNTVSPSISSNAISTALSVGIITLVNSLWPIRSRSLIRSRIHKNVKDHLIPLVHASIPPSSLRRVEQETVAALAAASGSTVMASEHDSMTDVTKKKKKKHKAELKLPPEVLIDRQTRCTAQQELLIKEAALEPLLLRTNFPEPEFTAIVAQQRRLAAALTPLFLIGDMLAAAIKDENLLQLSNSNYANRSGSGSGSADAGININSNQGIDDSSNSGGTEMDESSAAIAQKPHGHHAVQELTQEDIVAIECEPSSAARHTLSVYSLPTLSPGPSTSALAFLDIEPFLELAAAMCDRLDAVAVATKRKELTRLPEKRLYHSFLNFTAQFKSAVRTGRLPPSVSPLLYAFVHQIRVAVFEIEPLCSTLDRLHECKAFMNMQPAIPIFVLPTIRSRTGYRDVHQV